MKATTLTVLYEDNHLLAVNKPAGIATMGAAVGEPSLAAHVKAYLKEKYSKPGEVYLGIVSRLDASVTGAVLFARTSKAAARLTEQFRERHVEKTYWALVEGRDVPASAECVDWIRKNERAQRMETAPLGTRDAQEAKLSFRRLSLLTFGAHLEISLDTGRKHQIRVQLSSRGWPVLGDRKYGARRSFSPGIALHARYLRVEHPTRREPLEIVAPTPSSWRTFVAD